MLGTTQAWWGVGPGGLASRREHGVESLVACGRLSGGSGHRASRSGLRCIGRARREEDSRYTSAAADRRDQPRVEQRG